MKTKISIMFVAVLILSFVITPSADAAYKAWTCDVSKAETDDVGVVRIWFTCTKPWATYTRKHIAPVGQEKSMLAVALCAMTSGMQVEAWLNYHVQNSEIGYIRLVK